MKYSIRNESILLRPLRTGDYALWRKAFLEVKPKQKNLWDLAHKKENVLNRKSFQAELLEQKKRLREDKNLEFGIFVADETKKLKLVGFVFISNIVRSVSQSANLSYVLMNQYWGKGYGRKSVELAVTFSFEHLHLHRLEAAVEPRNDRSIQILKQNAFKKEGLSRKRYFVRDQWRDFLIYSLTSEATGNYVHLDVAIDYL